VSWSRLAALSLVAAATVVAADLALARISPVPLHIREVDDGIRDYERSDPDTLVLGSSHARSFLPLADMLDHRSGGQQHMLVVPVEWGTFSSYNWVLQNRLRPLIEERDGEGRLVRRRLSRAVLVTNFYDMCPKERTGSGTNLPARAWSFRHFLDDVRDHGLTDLNRNYLQTRWKDLWGGSVLVQNRGYDRVQSALSHLAGRSDAKAELQEFLEWSRHRMEEQYEYCHDDQEKRDLLETIDYLQGRRVEVTVVLFPLMPGIMTERSKATTLKRYSDEMAALQRERGFRLAEMTWSTPLVDDDFAPDADHVRADRNAKFAEWALEHDLRHLAEPLAAGGETHVAGRP
jgi:hypothetical protein